MINIEVHGYCLKSNRPEAQTRKLIDLVLCKNLPKYHVHRDNQRTLSVQFEINEEKLVLKIPRARNTRVWERVLSVFRGSDTARVFQGMLKLEEIGFLGARPILMAQRIVAGMTVDSFLIYEYLDGRPCTEADSKMIADTILKLHDLGYKRRDIHLLNFLISKNNQIGFIDFRLTKPRLFTQLQLDLELIQMFKSIPDTRLHVTHARLSNFNFKAAIVLYFIQTRVRKLRKDIKSLFTSYKPTH